MGDAQIRRPTMDAEFHKRLDMAHRRAAQLTVETARVVAQARELCHSCRNVRNVAGLIRSLRRFRPRPAG